MSGRLTPKSIHELGILFGVNRCHSLFDRQRKGNFVGFFDSNKNALLSSSVITTSAVDERTTLPKPAPTETGATVKVSVPSSTCEE